MIGIGIGTHGRRFSDVDLFDNDAQIYFDAVVTNGGVLTLREQNAYTVYRIDSKDNANTWNGDVHLDYPMLGSTVESCVINAHNPGTFDAVAVNTVSGDFTANGFDPNGADSYFQTGLVALDILTLNSIALEYYSREDIAEDAIDFAVRRANNALVSLFIRSDALAATVFDCYDFTVNGRLQRSETTSQGGFTATRVATNDSRVFRNGVQNGSTFLTTGGSQPAVVNFYIGARNNNGTADQFSNKQTAGNIIADGFTPAQVLAQYTARQLMNTNCVIGGRQV